MNASDLLKQQGWRGEGFSLDATNRGIAKPLLVKHKTDVSGLGINKNDFAGQGQWWLNAFDTSLKDWAAGRKPAKVDPRSQSYHGLYSQFVKAATLQGTFTSSTDESNIDSPAYKALGQISRKVGSIDSDTGIINRAAAQSADDRRARKAAKVTRKTEKRARKEEIERKKSSKAVKSNAGHTRRRERSSTTKEVQEQSDPDDINLKADNKKEAKRKRKRGPIRDPQEKKAAKLEGKAKKRSLR